jgi:hypothetical protein
MHLCNTVDGHLVQPRRRGDYFFFESGRGDFGVSV